jgi:hypothetical protein
MRWFSRKAIAAALLAMPALPALAAGDDCPDCFAKR